MGERRAGEGGRVEAVGCRAQRALRDAGHEFDKVIAARGIPFGLFTTGRRPELKRLSGQEKLSVLALGEGATISVSATIIEWARTHAPAQPLAGLRH